ncbi:family 18 glycosyl hydrolase [Colletotrichum cereale]|nr:family 18 glycosyl hydrolase [Colletotrichum cereale]
MKVSVAALLVVGAAAAPSPRSSNQLVASTYFAGYHANRGFPVSSIPWEKFTDVKYAFAETTADGGLNLSKSAPDQLPVFVAAAREHNVKALLSIGGWTGSRYMSTALGSRENRTAFVKTCLDIIDQYNLDGLDFDYEYPNRQGLGCNAISPNDTTNFANFLTELRQSANKRLYLTAATSLNPWNDASGAPTTDQGGLRPFQDALDYLMIMGYDVFGPWAPTGGPNAPLASECDPRNNQGGIEEAIQSWARLGIAPSTFVLGIGAYGHGFSVNAKMAFTSPGVLNPYPPQDTLRRSQGDSWDDDPRIDECGNESFPSGTYTYKSLITEANFLNEAGNPREGIAYGYDDCSQTPFIYNETAQIWVSYDNVQSLTAKGEYIKSTGLGGFAMWEAGGDYNNTIVDAMRSVLGM